MKSKLMGNDGTPETAKSVEEFVELGKTDDITYNNFAVIAKTTDKDSSVLFPEHNVIYDYMKEIKEKCVELEFSDEDIIRYRYNPKKFCYHVYGHTEFYFIILAINNMCSFKDFNKRKIKVLYKSDLISLMNQIGSAESDYISKSKLKNTD